MDWSKAKNILIVAFIITNLILLYVISDNDLGYDTYPSLQEDFLEDVRSSLAEKDINLNIDIPKEIPSLPFLNIAYEVYDASEELAYRFLEEYTKDKSKENTYYNDKGEKLSVIGNKKIVYENNSNKEIYSQLDIKTLTNIAEEFLKDKGFKTSGYELKDYRVKNNKHILKFTKVYDGLTIETSYMIFEIDATGIKRFERQWIKSIVPNEKEILVTAAPEALLRLLLMEEHYGKTIVGIELCYYSDLEEQGPSTWKRIVKSNVEPAWKIIFEDGTEEFLKEY
ncbi:two-component system regulatory protein YycI [Caldisalinibacter kiritimatiensis]|uniref:Regulatory protein YycH-like domain-containing protein n=1 Tax=Caldisalinibacter kiritimatiensis TaxID=1304284 RepID=R1AU41_9FIRM|nr:two-component system regulatory protein YycI [Caldisalinibacter kiritimatiensis]EOD00187.1 hypothetical protein L21TH_1763 [Caldisalinibacter kiritimatiensis]